jgi:hypothetical protein
MTRPTRFCRVAWIVDDMDSTVALFRDLLGLGMRFGNIATDVIKAGIDEHGLEPIQLYVPAQTLPFMNGLPYPLVEIALAVDDCEASKRRLSAGGIEPSFTSPLPGPDTQEHLYANGFHGLPVMVCTDGDNESMMAPFKDLEAASPPKVGVVTMVVDSIDAVAGLFARYFDMDFVDTDPAGLGARAVVGAHRVKLVENPPAAVAGEAMQSLIATEMMFDDVEPVRARLEGAGYRVLHTRTFRSGGKGYYFGKTIAGLPLSIYPTADDAEARGLG